MYWLPSTVNAFQSGAPAAGLVDMTTEPLSSTATQSFMLRHDTPFMPLVPSTSSTLHAERPPVGSVEMTALPLLSTATHRFALGQETPMSPFRSGAVTTSHTAGLVGLVVVVGATVVAVVGGEGGAR